MNKNLLIILCLQVLILCNCARSPTATLLHSAPEFNVKELQNQKVKYQVDNEVFEIDSSSLEIFKREYYRGAPLFKDFHAILEKSLAPEITIETDSSKVGLYTITIDTISMTAKEEEHTRSDTFNGRFFSGGGTYWSSNFSLTAAVSVFDPKGNKVFSFKSTRSKYQNKQGPVNKRKPLISSLRDELVYDVGCVLLGMHGAKAVEKGTEYEGLAIYTKGGVAFLADSEIMESVKSGSKLGSFAMGLGMVWYFNKYLGLDFSSDLWGQYHLSRTVSPSTSIDGGGGKKESRKAYDFKRFYLGITTPVQIKKSVNSYLEFGTGLVYSLMELDKNNIQSFVENDIVQKDLRSQGLGMYVNFSSSYLLRKSVFARFGMQYNISMHSNSEIDDTISEVQVKLDLGYHL